MCSHFLRRGVLAIAASIALLVPAIAGAQAAPRNEYEIKAAYLFTFGRFVEWPTRTAADSPFTICVLGTDPFGSTLDTLLAGATIRTRSVAARRIATAEEVAGCHILFVSASEARHIDPLVQSLKEAGVLTVSDMPQFAEHGGMIQFVKDANRIRFEINLESAREARLMLSSELLRVASAVRNGRGTPQ